MGWTRGAQTTPSPAEHQAGRGKAGLKRVGTKIRPLVWVALISGLVWLVHWLSYVLIKGRILRRQRWDLNICCGKTDGGGVNVDIAQHGHVPNLVLVNDVCRLPFREGQFQTVLCSHTMEHVDRPDAFYRELQRVGRQVTVVIPPLWDVTAAYNPLDHKWTFLTLRKAHLRLPPHVRTPLASTVQRILGQRNRP